MIVCRAKKDYHEYHLHSVFLWWWSPTEVLAERNGAFDYGGDFWL